MRGKKKDFFMPDSESQQYPDYLTELVPPLSPEGDRERGRSGSHNSASLVVMLLLILTVLAALASLATYARHWKKEVIVRGFAFDGASIISESELLLRIKDYKGSNLQELDTERLKQRIMVIPYLRDAVISRELNGIVRIKVSEREPVALAVIGSTTMVIDREGFLLPWKQEIADRLPELFVVGGIIRSKAAGNGLQQLDRREVALILQFLEALSTAEYASLLIREFHLAGNNMSWCIAVQAPTRFIVGNDGNFKEKLKKFEIFWRKVVSKKGSGFYDTVDLRFRGRIFATASVPPEVTQSVSR